MAEKLRERVGARATATGARPAAPGAEVAVAEPRTMRQQIGDMLPQFEMAMPKGFEAQQLVRDAYTLLRQNPKLGECTPESVLGGLMTFAQLGLRPGVMGQGWLIPFTPRVKVGNKWQNGTPVAQIIIGYLGYVELVHRSGAIRKITGRAVHQNDHFYVDYGMDERLEHRPPPAGTDRGPVVAYYSIIFYKDGDPTFWTMTRDEGLEWRQHYAMSTKKNRETGEYYGSGPWWEEEGPVGGSGFDQQVIKTCFLRAKRFAPKSTDRALNAAAEVDGAVRVAFKAPASPDDVDDMLNAEHPDPRDVVIDGDTVEPQDGAARGMGAQLAEEVAQQRVEAVKDGQLSGIKSMLTRAGITDDGDVLRILAHIVGHPVEKRDQLTYDEGAQILTTLGDWQRTDLAAECRAVLGQQDAPAAAPAPDAQQTLDGKPAAAKLPKPGTRAWHTARHPQIVAGELDYADVDTTDQCGYCDGPQGGGA